MYLYKEKHFGGIDKEMKEAKVVDSEGKVAGKVKAGRHNTLAISTNIAYWRKANAVHKWFCELDDGRDECQRISVSIDQLRELKELCEKVKDVAVKGQCVINLGNMGKLNEDHKYVEVEPIVGEKGSYGFKIGTKQLTADQVKDGDWVMELGENGFTDRDEPVFIKKVKSDTTQLTHYEVYKVGEGIANAEEIAEILPTEGGFFFGSTDYDEYYLQDIDLTIEQLSEIIEDYEQEIKDGAKGWDIDYYYQASW